MGLEGTGIGLGGDGRILVDDHLEISPGQQLAPINLYFFNPVRIVDFLKRCAGMPRLTAGFLAGLFPRLPIPVWISEATITQV